MGYAHHVDAQNERIGVAVYVEDLRYPFLLV